MCMCVGFLLDLGTICWATFRQRFIFLAFLKLYFPFLATFISFGKKSQLNSAGLYYCVSVSTLAQIPTPAWRRTPEVSSIT